MYRKVPIIIIVLLLVTICSISDCANNLNKNSILYGGILRYEPDILANGSREAQIIVNATLLLTRELGLADSVPPDSDFQPVVSQVTKKKLPLTWDGHTPAFYMYEGGGKDGRMHRFKRQVFFGILYSFTVSWALGSTSSNDGVAPLAESIHHFTVSRDLKKRLYIYEHRISCDSDSRLLDGQETCDADGICDRKSVSSLVGEAGQRATPSPKESLSGWRQCQQLGMLSSPLHTSKSVTILSYNIWNFNAAQVYGDDYARRVRRIGRLCRQSNAAIIAFQEVRFDFGRGGKLGPSQIDHLSRELKGYQFVFQAAMTYPEGVFGRVEEGPAVFSVFPIVSSDYILLPRDLGDEQDTHQRILLHAEIKSPQLGPVHVFVTHLSLSEVARNKSVAAMWKFMRQFDGLLVLAGDLNAEPQSAAMQYLAGLAEVDGSITESLMDAWTVFHKEPRPAAPDVYDDFERRDHGLTFSTLEDDLVKRIDYLFYRTPSSVKHTSTSIVDDGGRWDDATSDHLGVSAVFEPVLDQ